MIIQKGSSILQVLEPRWFFFFAFLVCFYFHWVEHTNAVAITCTLPHFSVSQVQFYNNFSDTLLLCPRLWYVNTHLSLNYFSCSSSSTCVNKWLLFFERIIARGGTTNNIQSHHPLTHTSTLCSRSLFFADAAREGFCLRVKGAVYIFVSLSSHLSHFFSIFVHKTCLFNMRVVNHNTTACVAVHLANQVGTWTHRRFVCVFVRHRDAAANEQEVQLTRGEMILAVFSESGWLMALE